MKIRILTADGREKIKGNLTVEGALDIIHTATEADDHALELDVDAAGYGDVKAVDIDYITGAISAGEDEGIILVNIDEIAATGGDVFALEVLATDGSAGVYGMKVGALIGPIHQNSGTFANPTTGTNNTPSTDVPDMIDGDVETTTAIFQDQNEYIIIGEAGAFEEIEFILTTPASLPGIKPTFWYSTVGTGQFTEFTPVDGTNGFRNTGVVAWDASDLTGHVADGVTLTFDIKIIRSRKNLAIEPVLGYAKVAATTEYIWDKSGNLTVAALNVGTATGAGTGAIHFSGDISNAGKESNMTKGLVIDQDANDNLALAVQSSDVAHDMADYADGSSFFAVRKRDAALGGARVDGFSDGDMAGLELRGFIGATNPTDTRAAVQITGRKSTGGGGATAVGAAETVAQILNYTTALLTILGDGKLGIGKLPSSKLDIDLATEDLEIVDAGSAGATEQDWIEVEVGGNQGYIRVYAAK